MSDILDDYEDAMFDRGKIVEHIPLARLRELASAEREGRLVVLPPLPDPYNPDHIRDAEERQ